MMGVKEIRLVPEREINGTMKYVAEAPDLGSSASSTLWAEGKTPQEALGQLVSQHAAELGLEINYQAVEGSPVSDFSDPFESLESHDPEVKVDPRDWEKNPFASPISDEQIDYLAGDIAGYQLSVRNWIDGKKWDLRHRSEETPSYLPNDRESVSASAGFTDDLSGDQLYHVQAALTFYGLEHGLSEVQYLHAVYTQFEDDVKINGFRSALRRLRQNLKFYLENPNGPV